MADPQALVNSQNVADELKRIAETLRRSTVQVRGRRSGGGSGVIWRSDGVIVTNAHVARTKRLEVELHDGRSMPAELTARDDERDIAALRVDASDLPAAQIGDSDALRPGELAFAVGNPLGIVGAVTSGVVFAGGAHGGRRAQWIQADVRIAPGNSGGPLADARGRVVGINSMIYGGLAVAVPSNAVQRFVGGDAARPRLGVTIEPVPLRLRGGALLSLLVCEIADGSPAQRAGMLLGDAIVRVGGRPLARPADLPDALAELAPGARLQLHVLRSGEVHELPVSFETDERTTAAA
jgi:serine protease Do